MHRILVNCWVVSLFSGIFLACTPQPKPTDPVELEKTWQQAGVMVPVTKAGYTFPWRGTMDDKKVIDALGAISKDKRAPVIVYLHGCSAPGWHASARLMERFAESGYVVIGPNSYARSHRQSSCEVDNWWVYRGRQAEIEYAVNKVSSAPWADLDNLFLIGHSEGGEVASRYQGTAFKGIVISGATCYKGVSAGASTKVLSVSSAGDSSPTGATRECPGADEEFIISGTLHNVLGNSEVAERVFEFVTSLTSK